MAQISIDVPDKELDLPIKLIKKFNYNTSTAAKEKEEDIEVPERHKKTVREGIKNTKKSDYLK